MTMRTPTFDTRRLTPGDWAQLAAADDALRADGGVAYARAWNTVRRLTGLDPESAEYRRTIRHRIRPATRDSAWQARMRAESHAAMTLRANDVNVMKAALRSHFG